MVKFVDVDPNELEMVSERRRGRVSYPILKSFLETRKYCVMLDRTGMQQSLMSLNSCLNSYIKGHDLPIKVINRKGQIYLLRLDIDENGKTIPDWREASVKSMVDGTTNTEHDEPIRPITSDEVKKRSAIERHRVTK